MIAALNAAHFCELVTDGDSDKYFSVSRALQIWFISSKVTAYKYWVSGITCHMYSRDEMTRLTGEINDISAFIPGA